MNYTQNTLSAALGLEDALVHLASSRAVDGIAFFGSRSDGAQAAISDYDILLLVNCLPVGIFQMLTHIDGRMTDVVFVETGMADRLLAAPNAVQAGSFEGMFLLKMQTARIVHDATGRLGRVQQWVRQSTPEAWLLPFPYSDLYAA